MPGLANPTIQPPYHPIGAVNPQYGQMQNCTPKGLQDFQNENSIQTQQDFQRQLMQSNNMYGNRCPQNQRRRDSRQGRGQQTQNQFCMYNQKNMFQGRRGENSIKRFNNWFYCHTQGFDTSHPSNQCTRPNQGHNYYATHQNTIGGSMKGLHKT